MGKMTFTCIEYTSILSSDAAGEVIGIGHTVTCFKVGDRVANGSSQKYNTSAKAAFQTYRLLGPYGTADSQSLGL